MSCAAAATRRLSTFRGVLATKPGSELRPKLSVCARPTSHASLPHVAATGKVLIHRWSPNFRPIFDGVIVPLHHFASNRRCSCFCSVAHSGEPKVLFWNIFVLAGGAEREAPREKRRCRP